MEQKKILYVINEKSGADNKTDLEGIIDKLGKENKLEHEIVYLPGSNAEDMIRDKIEEFKPRIVAAGGGDGTINLVASIIKGMPLELGIIPLGSANGLANEIGIPGNVEDALKLIITGVPRPMDIVQINENRICIHLSDVGMNARVVKEFEKEGKRGFTGYIRKFINELSKPLRTFKCLINIDNTEYTHKAFMIIIANASSYRSGANMNPRGRTDDGRFEIIVMKPHQRWLWRSFLGAFTGTLDKQPHIENYDCTSAVIKISPSQEFQVDGESLGKNSEIRANINKHALSVILPQ